MTDSLKKVLIFAAMPAVLMLGGCGAEEKAPDKLAERFTVSADITDGDFTASADMQRTDSGWQISMTAPESVEGMTFTLGSGGIRADYSELSYSAGEDQYPTSSPLRLTASALDRCVNSKPSGSIFGQSYEVTFKDGKPAAITVGSDLTVKLTAYKPSK